MSEMSGFALYGRLIAGDNPLLAILIPARPDDNVPQAHRE
jgi:hypothetical protein